jgi:hypothetical protein
MFHSIYNILISFEVSEHDWTILCEGDIATVKEDLEKYNINCSGKISTYADISEICNALTDVNLKRRFIAGLADTIGSTAKSHRRFTDEFQIISLEFNGFNYNFICNICRLLCSINCFVDQINWNHPNIHCSNNPYYRNWNKGTKIRILLDQFATFGAFAFKTKAESSKENLSFQEIPHYALPCNEQKINISPACFHPGENDARLPKLIRGGHYIHFRHICAVLGCENAPYDKIYSNFSNLGSLINPFPIQCRGSFDMISDIISKDTLLAGRNYTIKNINIDSFLKLHSLNHKHLLYGSDFTGYPINEVLKAIAYIIADEDELFGTRPKDYLKILNKHVNNNDINCNIILQIPDLLTPLVIYGNDRGVLIGANNPQIYSKLAIIDPNIKFKVIIRPITVGDLINAH